MGLHPQNIGTSMPHGFAGGYARQPDMIINTRPAGDTIIPFGTPLKYDENDRVVPMGSGDTAEKFVGIASREIKTALTYLEQDVGAYAPNEPVSVFMRGAINVKCQKGKPKLGGDVYVRTAESKDYPGAAIAVFEAEEDGGSTVKLNGCQWAGPADSDGIAELVILTRQNA